MFCDTLSNECHFPLQVNYANIIMEFRIPSSFDIQSNAKSHLVWFLLGCLEIFILERVLSLNYFQKSWVIIYDFAVHKWLFSEHTIVIIQSFNRLPLQTAFCTVGYHMNTLFDERIFKPYTDIPTLFWVNLCVWCPYMCMSYLFVYAWAGTCVWRTLINTVSILPSVSSWFWDKILLREGWLASESQKINCYFSPVAVSAHVWHWKFLNIRSVN